MRNSSEDITSVLAKKFWAILFGILTTTIAASAMTIWATATPFLRDFQNDVIAKNADQQARSLEGVIDQHGQLLAFLASQRDLISVAMGYVDDPEILLNYTNDAELPDQLIWLGLLDAFAEPIATKFFQTHDSTMFDVSDLGQLASEIIKEPKAGLVNLLMRQDGHEVQILIGVPVYNAGFTEGALLGVLTLNLEEQFPANDIVQSTSIIQADLGPGSAESDEMDITRATVSDTSLVVSIEPDREGIAATGRNLMLNSAGSMAFVLFSAFGIFAWFVRTGIIRPYLELEMKKRELSELASVAKLANDGIIVTDLEQKVLWCNPAFERLSGYSIDEIRGRRPRDFLHGPKTTETARKELRNSIKSGRPSKTEILNYTKTGEPYWISISISPLSDEDGQIYGFMAISNDITEARRQRDALIASKTETEHQSLHDPLTHLPNRRSFDRALATRSMEGVENGTIIRIDLDHFKHINDNMGHAAGDFALCEVAKVLQSGIRSGGNRRFPDLAARVGGDEFVILMSPDASVEVATNMALRLLREIKKPMQFEGRAIQIGASFGVASTNGGLLRHDELLAGADAALYAAKENGRSTVCHYTPSLHTSVMERRELARELRVAINNREFEPFFQPQIDAVSGEISGVEMLARWPSQALGLRMPDEFIPIASQLSLLSQLDQILFEKAVGYISDLRPKTAKIAKLSFNVTADRLLSGSAFASIKDLDQSGPKIAVEVLESVIVEEQTDAFQHQIDQLRSIGVSIEIDDFGSGHTSVVGIMELNPDVMKIDRRLIIPATENAQAKEMLHQIVGMAKIMGLKVTAEGVETLEHAKIAVEAGCDTLQGFALAKPMPIDELARFASSRAPTDFRWSA